MKYFDFDYFELDKDFIKINKLINIGSDSSGWRLFYNNKKSNWIVFYPFSEYHGGGQPYVLNIDGSDFEEWLIRNSQFEKEIRKQIEEKKTATNTS